MAVVRIVTFWVDDQSVQFPFSRKLEIGVAALVLNESCIAVHIGPQADDSHVLTISNSAGVPLRVRGAMRNWRNRSEPVTANICHFFIRLLIHEFNILLQAAFCATGPAAEKDSTSRSANNQSAIAFQAPHQRSSLAPSGLPVAVNLCSP